MALSEGSDLYWRTQQVRSDGVIAAWKADNLSILYSFSGIARPSWFGVIKIFSESYGIH